MGRYTKEEAIAMVVECAEKYHTELEGKNLLFICTDKHKQTTSIEFSFHRGNYMHLTGLKPSKRAKDGLPPNDFYQKCLEHKLSIDDFEFSEDGTTHLKLDIISEVICKNLRANMVGDYNSSKPRLYTEKIVGNIHACMGFTFDEKTSEYVPNTVIQDRVQELTFSTVRVIAVYRKDAHAKRYEELTYKAKKVDWATIRYPEDLKYLLTL